jgi:CRISPR-associated exonuclease Cas4
VETDLVPLSALQHYLFCPRQCALIHVEQAWAENRLTAEGRVLHEATAEAGTEKRRGVRVVTAMPLVSKRLGVSGIADLVEMHACADPAQTKKGDGGKWRPFPVEYKRGKPKSHRADEVQLCAQAMALEEMFSVTLDEGALFYGETRRRVTVPLDAGLRSLTEQVAAATRALLNGRTTPPPVYAKSTCTNCSLNELCQPKRLSRKIAASAWLAQQIAEASAPGLVQPAPEPPKDKV